MFSFQIFVGSRRSRRKLVANSIHTADTEATPTRLNSTVEWRRRRRCVLGISYESIDKIKPRVYTYAPPQRCGRAYFSDLNDFTVRREGALH